MENVLSSREEGKIIESLYKNIRDAQLVKPGDSYLIVNRSQPYISQLVEYAAQKLELKVIKKDFTEPTAYKHSFPDLSLLELNPAGSFGVFGYEKLGETVQAEETPARISMIKDIEKTENTRGFHSPGSTIDMFAHALQNDYQKTKELSYRLSKKLDDNKIRKLVQLHVTTDKGTDAIFKSIPGVIWKTDCREIKKGNIANLPSGENYWEGDDENGFPIIIPSDGIIVIDLCVGGFERLVDPDKPIKVTIKNGRPIKYDCKDVRLKKDIKYQLGLWNGSDIGITEVGIGLNPCARTTGNMLEDEKALKTMHVALGGTQIMKPGQTGNPDIYHTDGLFSNPTCTAMYSDGSEAVIMKNGELIL